MAEEARTAAEPKKPSYLDYAKEIGATLAASAIEYTALLPFKVGFGIATNFFKKNPRFMKHLSPAAKKEVLNRYESSIQLGELDKATSEVFQTYRTNQSKDPSDLLDFKLDDDDKILSERFQKKSDDGEEASDAVDVNQKLVNEIKPNADDQEKLNTAEGKFNEALEQYKKSQKGQPNSINAYGALQGLYEAKGKCVKAILMQQNRETDRVEELFKRPDEDEDPNPFLEAVKNQFPDDTGEQKSTEMKDGVLKKLNARHTEELTAVEKALNHQIQKIHNQIRGEENRIVLLAAFMSKNKSLEKKFEALHRQRDAEEAGESVSVAFDSEDKGAMLRNIRLSDLENLKSITGRKISQHQDDKTGIVSYSLDLPSEFLNPRYWKEVNTDMKADFTSMALACAATGMKGVTATLSHPNENVARNMARAAFEAAREVGYKSKDIELKIDVNGKVKTLTKADLYGEKGNIRADKKDLLKEHKGTSGAKGLEKEYKDQMTTIREKVKAKKEANDPSRQQNDPDRAPPSPPSPQQ